MDEQKVTKRNVKWFLGGASIATVINNPELLTKFQEISRKLIK